MGWWSETVLPRVMARTTENRVVDRERRQVCAGLTGRLVEVGFGSGSNLSFLPPEVTGVWAVEPSDTAWRLSDGARSRAGIPVVRAGLTGEHLDLADGSMDSALSTLTLCTIPDLPRALAELRRVLKPSGALHYLEHGVAPDAGTVRWQRRIEPFQKRFVGGCHLTRDIPILLREAGFTLEATSAAYLPLASVSRPWSYVYRGRAVR
ncbi:MAG: class I SAM-dependent methyltransferase [Intrasporangium sp.]|uniref:class I SAM-dependent methyltransferase n=1 Tax=Intrasporangium sp. TaxID=1925024 RepID=UPI003F818949